MYQAFSKESIDIEKSLRAQKRYSRNYIVINKNLHFDARRANDVTIDVQRFLKMESIKERINANPGKFLISWRKFYVYLTVLMTGLKYGTAGGFQV